MYLYDRIMMISDADRMMMIRSTGKFQYSPLENSADNSLLKVLPNRLPAQFWPHFSNLKTFPRQRKTNADSKSVPLWTFTCGSKVISRIKKIRATEKYSLFTSCICSTVYWGRLDLLAGQMEKIFVFTFFRQYLKQWWLSEYWQKRETLEGSSCISITQKAIWFM